MVFRNVRYKIGLGCAIRERGTKQECPVELKQEFKFVLQQRGRRSRSGFAVAGLHKCVQGESLDISK